MAREEAHGLDLGDVLGVDHHLKQEGDPVRGAERGAEHDLAEAAFAADLVVRGLGRAVEAEVDRGEVGFALGDGLELLEQAGKALAVGDEVPGEVVGDDRVEDPLELGVQRRLTPGEGDLGAAVDRPRLVHHFLHERERKIFRYLLRIAQAMLAIELATVGDVEADDGDAHGAPPSIQISAMCGAVVTRRGG